MLPRAAADETDVALFTAPFVVVSHGTQADPILNYGNHTALNLWEMTWEQLTQMPSRLTAEPMHRDERAPFMARVRSQGYVGGYRGVRISSSRKRFMIDDAIILGTCWTNAARVWGNGDVCGVAAVLI